MTILFMSVSLLTGSLAAWILFSIFRHPRSLPAMLDRIESTRADLLCSFVEVRTPRRDYRDNDLWKTIGGISGLREIHRECGILFTLSLQFAQQYPEEARADELEGLVLKCVYLRVQVWVCLLEELARRQFSGLPRMQAYALAKLYCDIFDTIEAIRSLPLAEPS